MHWLTDHERLAWILLAVSAVVSIGGLIASPFIVLYMPADYFAENAPRAEAWRHRHVVVHWAIVILKNLLGAILIISGAIMALPLVPGPGLVTLLIGLSLVDFPGKRRIERKLVSHPRVLGKINQWRAKAGQPPLVL